MLDCKPELVTTLTTILPTYYELFCDSTTATPCITYREHSNSDNQTAKTFGYSNVGWYIKIWCNSVEDMTGYAGQVDSAMRTLGYSRSSSNELVLGNQLCKVMIYTGLGIENY